MIEIKDKASCCGCNACTQICPVGCITMREDEEGFLYPEVERSQCIECGACEGVCPVINVAPPREPLKVYAARCRDEQLRACSSSGGAFTLLAEWVTGRGGVIFGARFDDEWQVIHASATTMEGLAPFRGSKYVQSRVGESFIEARAHLEAGRMVLFSGTPCQIAALKLFLARPYKTLIAVDIICHGVPSPMVWRRYLEEVSGGTPIYNINFRDKSQGWSSYNIVIESELKTLRERGFENPYIKGFLRGLYERPSCHSCPVREMRGGGDITLADYWGIEKQLPEWSDDRGVGLLLVHSEHIATLLSELDVELREMEYRAAIAENPAALRSRPITPQRAAFFKSMDQGIASTVERLTRRSKFSKFIYKLKRKFKLFA